MIEYTIDLKLTDLYVSEQQGNESRPKWHAKATSSLKKAECKRCLPPRTTGSSYSYCLSNISGRPLTKTARAVSETNGLKMTGVLELAITSIADPMGDEAEAPDD
jgi:hypothetical protein